MNESLATRKLNSIRKIPTDDPDFLRALLQVSSFYDKNTPSARGAFKSSLEHRYVSSNDEFLAGLDDLLDSIDAAEEVVKEMQATCDELCSNVEQTRCSSLKICTEVEELRRKKQAVDAQLHADRLFKLKLVPSEDDIRILRDSGTAVGESFFLALSRLLAMKEDCKELLRNQNHRPDLCLDILDHISEVEQAAMQKLYRSTQQMCTAFEDEDVIVPPLLQPSLHVLHVREAFYKHCISEIEKRRTTVLMKMFSDRVQKGGPGGIPRPIEQHSHIPERYIKDMLAVLHEQVACEHGLFVDVFRARESHSSLVRGKKETLVRTSSGVVLDESAAGIVETVIDHITEPVVSALFTRAQKVLENCQDVIILVKISNLFQFYREVFAKHCSPSSTLISSLTSARKATLAKVLQHLKQKSDMLTLSPPIPPSDGSPPMSLNSQMEILTQLLKNVDSSRDEEEQRDDIVASVLRAVVEPMIQVCMLSATGLGEVDVTVYLLNCFVLIDTSLRNFSKSPLIDKKREALSAQIDAYLGTAAQLEAQHLLQSCHLSSLWGEIAKYQEKASGDGIVPLLQRPGMDVQSVSRALSLFEESLFTDALHQIPVVGRICDDELSKSCRRRSLVTLLNTYQRIYEALNDPKNGYVGVMNPVCKYDPAQVKAFLKL